MENLVWTKKSVKQAPINVPCLFKVKNFENSLEPGDSLVVYGWRAAADDHIELRGYYRDWTIPGTSDYEWMRLPK